MASNASATGRPTRCSRISTVWWTSDARSGTTRWSMRSSALGRTSQSTSYITGTASHGEHFHAPHDLPNPMSPNVGETCVTVTWLQLTTRLFRATGAARYGAAIERTVYNHL